MSPTTGFLKQLYADPFRHWSPDELVAIGLGRPAVCDPGACWSYAHTNFVILGKVLEKVGGKPLATLIREGVVAPLRLGATRSEPTARIEEPVLHAFDAERGRTEEIDLLGPVLDTGGGRGDDLDGRGHADQRRGDRRGAAGVGGARMRLQLAPGTAKFPPWDARKYYGLGVFSIDGWVVQNPFFSGYAATMAYLPARKLAIAVSTTHAARGVAGGESLDRGAAGHRRLSRPGGAAVRARRA